MTIRLVLAASLLVSCAPPGPCSPLAAALLDESCVEAIAVTLDRQCPDADGVADCPEAMAVQYGCFRAIDAHAGRCDA